MTLRMRGMVRRAGGLFERSPRKPDRRTAPAAGAARQTSAAHSWRSSTRTDLCAPLRGPVRSPRPRAQPRRRSSCGPSLCARAPWRRPRARPTWSAAAPRSSSPCTARATRRAAPRSSRPNAGACGATLNLRRLRRRSDGGAGRCAFICFLFVFGCRLAQSTRMVCIFTWISFAPCLECGSNVFLTCIRIPTSEPFLHWSPRRSRCLFSFTVFRKTR
jgi:hypothetical protein